MPLDKSWIGRKGGRARIVIERAPVTNFARAVKDFNPVYANRDAAKAAGFEDIPVPPTFLIGAGYWGTHAELQPDDPGTNPQVEVVGEYGRMGGLLLHGEQSFTYERPLKVGDVLDLETEIIDTYEKTGGTGTMTFTITDTTYRDAKTGELVATARNNFINRRSN
jgi:acyl dehydratase